MCGQQYLVVTRDTRTQDMPIVCITGPYSIHNDALREADKIGPDGCVNEIFPLNPPLSER